MSQYDYIKDQVNNILPSDRYGISIKIRTTKGETKWMLIKSKEDFEKIKYELEGNLND